MSDEALPHQVLDGDRLRELFSEVDAFVDPEGAPVDVVICGGAALALRWDDRSTIDVDSLDQFPSALVGAIHTVGARNGLKTDWFNEAASVFRPEGLQTETVYQGQRLRVLAATRPYLLAMKVYAARPDDVEDIERLMRELGFRASHLLPLVRSAYDDGMVESHKNAIGRLISELAAREGQERDQPGPDVDSGL